MRQTKYYFIIIITLILSGCLSNTSYNPTPPKKPDYAIVNVLYATDRDNTGKNNPKEIFGPQRGEMSYGVCAVSIPKHHLIGVMEEPSIFRLEFKEDPGKHVALLNVQPQNKDDFFTNLAEKIKQSDAKKAFIFIHGYNVTFENAARRTAQIYYDLGIDIVPVFYSWPSQGNTVGYPTDEQNVEWTQTNLRNFLKDFLERSDAQNIYLIAHSMGNRALTRALIDVLNANPTYRSRIKEVILTAPDIDADVFKRDIAPALTASGESVTLYTSAKDKALMASHKFHGYIRAGDSGNKPLTVQGIETIDATNVDTSFLGHSYVAEERSVLSDMFYLIDADQRANQRFGLRYVEDGQYWKFK